MRKRTVVVWCVLMACAGVVHADERALPGAEAMAKLTAKDWADLGGKAAQQVEGDDKEAAIELYVTLATAVSQLDDLPDRAMDVDSLLAKIERLVEQAEAAGTGPEDLAWVEPSVCYVVARIGKVEEAEARAKAIASPTDPISARTSVAWALHEMGKGEAADKLVDELADKDAADVEDDFDREYAMAEVVWLLASAGRAEQAEQLIGRIEDAYSVADAWAVGAEMLADAGHHEAALRWVPKAQAAIQQTDGDPEMRNYLHNSLATALAQLGKPAEAMAEAGRVAGAMEQVFAAGAVAEAYHNAGDAKQAEYWLKTTLTRARAAAQMPPDPDWGDQSYYGWESFASAAYACGRFDLLAEGFGHMTTPRQRAAALAVIAFDAAHDEWKQRQRAGEATDAAR